MKVDGSGLVQHTFENEYDIGSISPLDGSHVIYQKLGDVFVLDVLGNASEKLDIKVPPAAIASVERLKLDPEDAPEAQVSDDGNNVVLIIHGKLWQIDRSSLSASCIECRPGVRVTSARLSSDGRSVIALTDAGGEYDIYRYDAETARSPQRIANTIDESIIDVSLSPNGRIFSLERLSATSTTSTWTAVSLQAVTLSTRAMPQDISWSASGRYAVFVTYTKEDIGVVTTYDPRCNLVNYLTSGRYDLWSPVFSTDGLEIYFIAETNFRSTIIGTRGPRNYWPIYDHKSLLYAVDLEWNRAAHPAGRRLQGRARRGRSDTPRAPTCQRAIHCCRKL